MEDATAKYCVDPSILAKAIPGLKPLGYLAVAVYTKFCGRLRLMSGLGCDRPASRLIDVPPLIYRLNRLKRGTAASQQGWP